MEEEDTEAGPRRAEPESDLGGPTSIGFKQMYTATSDYQEEAQETRIYEKVERGLSNAMCMKFSSSSLTPASSRDRLAAASSRYNHVAPGSFFWDYLAPTLLLVILLISVILQLALIFLKVSDRSVTSNDSRVAGPIAKTPTTRNGIQQFRPCFMQEQPDAINGSHVLGTMEETALQGNESQQINSTLSQDPRCPRCPPLWFGINGKCYFFSETKKTSKDSEQDCADRNASLATMKEEAILTLVRSTGQDFWIGLIYYITQGGEWTGRWPDGRTESLSRGAGSCAKLGTQLGAQLSLENCYLDLPWICERDAQ